MACYFFIFLLSMVLPSMAVTPQQLINGGHLLYDALVQGNYKEKHSMLKNHDKLTILERAREVAKQKKDAGMTQYLTEQIIEQQNNSLRKQLPMIILSVAATSIGFVGGYLFRLINCVKEGGTSCSDLQFYKFSWL